jgi:hypothetical protein
MNNQYIYFPNLDLDLFLIKEIVIKNLNLSIPHGVFTGPLRTRIIMSWSITDDYETTKQLLSIY